MSISQKLDHLRKQVMHQIVFGDLELRVTDDEGKMPVIVALGDERLAVLVSRVSSVGGSANVFIECDDKLYELSAIRTECALMKDDAENLKVPGRAESTVSMFLDALMQAPNGINLSMPRPYPEYSSIRAENPRELALA